MLGHDCSKERRSGSSNARFRWCGRGNPASGSHNSRACNSDNAVIRSYQPTCWAYSGSVSVTLYDTEGAYGGRLNNGWVNLAGPYQRWNYTNVRITYWGNLSGLPRRTVTKVAICPAGVFPC